MLEAVLDEWAALQPGWDEENSPAIPKENLVKLMWVLAELERLALPAPEPFIAGDGEIGLQYRTQNDQSYADICILADHSMLSFAIQDGEVRARVNKTIDTVVMSDLDGFFDVARLIK